ncbi:hypothetical protein [Nocardioides albidus]|uniref:hypothetical protein n=1 Tax=Nocardioides albidus TaxID=1517589 RepID=UPI001F00D85A|nr:hypothetical protein [Nocardioides albidus]
MASVSADGVGNLAPRSFFTVASGNPPIVRFTSVGEKDTLRNVLQTREFTMVVGVTLDPDAMVEGRPVFERLAPVSRLGGSAWGLPPALVRLVRPS